VLAMGVALPSPIVAPKTMEMICSGTGAIQLIELGQHGEVASAGQHTLDCATCLPVFLPSASMTSQVSQPQPLAHALTPAQAAHIAALVGAPLPPRGPPARS